MEKLNNGRSKITTEGNTTKLTIPVKRNYLIIIFSLIWLLVWFSFFSSFNTTFGLFNDDGIDTFFMIWLTFWIIGELAVMILLLWNLFGKENIVLNSKYLEINRNLFGIGRKNNMTEGTLKNLDLMKFQITCSR